MDAILGVWFTSLLGAAAFSTAGYVLGQRGVVLPLLGLPDRPKVERGVRPDIHSLPTPVAGTQEREVPKRNTMASLPAPPSTPPVTVSSPHITELAATLTLPEDETRPTFIPDRAAQAAVVASAVATLPPPQTPSLPAKIDMRAIETMKDDVDAALSKAEAAMQRARTAEAMKSELERQVEALRAELRNEVVARATAASRAEELGDRLASASAEASSLRHKVSLLDKQSRQLREALQGRVRALTTSEWHRRRDLEEAEEMRVKLRDVYEKLERSSMPPSSPAASSRSDAPRTDAPRTPSLSSIPRGVAPPSISLSDDPSVLREEVARLRKENHDLRTRALGNITPKQRSRGSMPELDLDVYQGLVRRIGGVAGLRGVVIADEMGSVLVGSGEHAEGMAAFGAYIRDASSRTDRLLPLDGLEEVDIRDRKGMLLSTRVLTQGTSELCLVLLGAADTSLAAAKKITAEHLQHV